MRATQRRPVTRITLGRPAVRRPDTLAGEEPLEIRVGGASLAVTMRTPGHDVELALGYLVAEGVVATSEDVVTSRFCAGVGPDGENTYNVLDVTLAPHVPPPGAELVRRVTTSSACGVCGRTSIDQVRTASRYPVEGDVTTIPVERLLAYPDALRADQEIFDRTGGLHAAALFDNATGERLVLREDVGRHNAVDKVVGWAVASGRLPLAGCTLQVSGRASFELVQKASTAGIPVLSAVSAPSALAVDLAVEVGMTLVGFVRGESLVVYSRPDRVLLDERPGLASTQPGRGPNTATPSSTPTPSVSAPISNVVRRENSTRRSS